MKQLYLHLFLLAALSLFVVGCSDSSSSKPDGGSVDSSVDSGVDDATTDDSTKPDSSVDGAEQMAVTIPDLSAPVDAVYDEYGILHLHCKTDADCFAALGYFHAYNRFFLMDFARRLIRGRLAELVAVGDAVLESDYAMRHFMSSADGEPLEDLAVKKLSPEHLALFERYADGVNAWIADVKAERNNAVLSSEYQLLVPGVIGEWTPADTMAVALYMIYDLADSVSVELVSAEIAAKVSPELASDLLMMRPGFQTFTTTSAGMQPVSWPDKLDTKRFVVAKNAIAKARQKLGHILKGDARAAASNNWIVAPERTKNGHALLANDPHLWISNPAIFFPVEIDSKSSGGSGTIHAAGGSIAGIPVIPIGRNETIAWGATVVGWDLNEVYLETLNAAGTAVIFNGQEVPLKTKTFTFGNAAGEPVEKTFKYVPHHGPLLSVDGTSGVSVRWIPAEGITEAAALIGLMQASTVSEAKETLRDITAVNQNWVVVDNKGNLGWYPFVKLPSRPWATLAQPPWLPVPGDGTAEWAGFIDTSDLPQATNPPAGMLATANQPLTNASADNDPTNNGEPAKIAYQGLATALGARMTRVIDLLETTGNEGKEHTVDTMAEMQADVYSLLGEKITPALIAATTAAELAPDVQKVVDALQSWKYTCPTGLATSDPEGAASSDANEVSESIGCTAFHAALFYLMREAFADEAAEADVRFRNGYQLKLLLLAITEPTTIKSNFWDRVDTSGVETKDEIMLAALEGAAKALVDWKADSSQWQWGRIHTLSKTSPFDNFGLAAFNAGPWANDGALLTVDVGNPYAIAYGDTLNPETPMAFHQPNGASLRIIVEASDSGLSMLFQLPGGTNLDRKDPKRYNQLVDRYLKNEYIDFHFGPDAVKEPDETIKVECAK